MDRSGCAAKPSPAIACRLRQEIEPVDAEALGRFLVSWHGVGSGRRGLEAVLDAIEQLQGAAVPASVLERESCPRAQTTTHRRCSTR